MKIYKILTLVLIIILAVDFIGQVFMAIVNPEVFLLGGKLSGEKARIYLIANALVSILSVVLLLKKRCQIGIILAILYFGYNLCILYISCHMVSPFVALSFVVSTTALMFFRLKL